MSYVDYEQSDRTVVIRLNRPERRNSMSTELMEELAAAWDRFIADDSAWVAILTGEGTAFCAGMDLKEARERGRALSNHRLKYPFVPDTDKPTISAVNGFAIGGGLVMAVNCDLRVAAEDAHLQLTEIQLGVIGGWDLGIVNRIPVAIANELSLLGGAISGRRAYEIGLFNRAVPRAEVMPAAFAIAERLISLPPWSVRTMKEILRAERPRGGEQGWQIYNSTREMLAAAEDTLEAVRAFNEKRKPVFTGR